MSNNNSKFFESDMPVPPRAPLTTILLAGLGGFCAIATIALVADFTQAILILGSFGASCVIVFALPDTSLAQPRNVIAGHFLSSLTGLVYLYAFGPHWWSLALAVGTAIAIMMLTRTVHPPAGSNPVIVFLGMPGWSFLLFPTLCGAVLLVLVALIYNNFVRKKKYPLYW
ncbi:membrane protein [Oxalicibacterium flavum]|uniref:Membrane protein n=1 Tax=Oxalicibacterium flavum TaxID=179467 RepID=A0A8J2UPC9_9BURK|nr:HPP family protein [Oxalicibacterium flavum]GGC00153.1 membrane protein [Oxalicibacterium flavum]